MSISTNWVNREQDVSPCQFIAVPYLTSALQATTPQELKEEMKKLHGCVILKNASKLKDAMRPVDTLAIKKCTAITGIGNDGYAHKRTIMFAIQQFQVAVQSCSDATEMRALITQFETIPDLYPALYRCFMKCILPEPLPQREPERTTLHVVPTFYQFEAHTFTWLKNELTKLDKHGAVIVGRTQLYPTGATAQAAHPRLSRFFSENTLMELVERVEIAQNNYPAKKNDILFPRKNCLRVVVEQCCRHHK